VSRKDSLVTRQRLLRWSW